MYKKTNIKHSSAVSHFVLRPALWPFALLLFSNNLFAQNPSPLEISQLINDYRASMETVIINDFVDLLALPNVAQNQADMDVNADHITSLLEQRGFTTQRLQSGGSPYVYAEMMQPGATETLLLYAHYDGQPVQVENWAYPPFTPTLLDAPLQAGGQPVDIAEVSGSFDPEWRLYARSAGDDKMPIIALMHTLDAMQANDIDLSVNLKLLLDGEEERGSPSVGNIIDENPGLLDADLLLFCDGPMHQSRNAQLVFGVRGSKTLDMTTYGANRPLHSGHYGNWAPNPIMQMTYLLTSMRDETGRILIDNYYDDVAPVNDMERSAIAAMPDITEALKNELAINTPEGDGVRLEELVTLPAINVRGISAGGVGPLGRNIILSNATASLNIRLVANQRPEGVEELIEAHIVNQGFHIVYEDPTNEILSANEKVIKLDWRGRGSPGLRTPMDDAMSQRLVNLMQSVTTDLILTPSMGGSLPLDDFATRMDTPIIVLPLANHDNNQHAENENIRLQNMWDAMSIYGVILANFGLE
ncbi:MAG: M20/M25/M40 family metallo-hydrolase [Gammaproteobacteria bacterium]|jgi:acetylornithine deacetylase/succinyl-diaminopimelate desuccinylase-like protein|nr:M20/M25/M40 family metallo-hydrolase [Gammaproteobacteria bacterium]